MAIFGCWQCRTKRKIKTRKITADLLEVFNYLAKNNIDMHGKLVEVFEDLETYNYIADTSFLYKEN